MIRKINRLRPRLGVLIFMCMLFILPLSGCPENNPEESEDSIDINGPEPPENLTARAYSDRIELTWDYPTVDTSEANKDIEGIIVVRGDGVIPNALPYREQTYEQGDTLGAGVIVYKGTADQFVDSNVAVGAIYYYETFLFDEIPNYGDSRDLNATPGSMIRARISHSQTLMADGRVLLVGGVGYDGPLADAEIFNPATLQFSEVFFEMRTSRFGHTATLLPDGRVLIVGGYEEGFLDTLDTAEIFDPETEKFDWVDDNMFVGRASHTATLLPDGTVLITGGTDGANGFKSAEIFDPEDETFTLQESEMVFSRYGHTATGIYIDDVPYVLIAGGFDGFATVPYASFYNVETGIFADAQGDTTLETKLFKGRLSHSANALLDGRVLIAGGYEGSLDSGGPLDVCELYDQALASDFMITGFLNQARSGHAAVVLNDGRVLVTGGVGFGLVILNSSEMYDPTLGTFELTGPLAVARTVPAATVLSDGTVLVTGGNDSPNLFEPRPVSASEIFDPSINDFSMVGK